MIKYRIENHCINDGAPLCTLPFWLNYGNTIHSVTRPTQQQ